MKPEKSGILFRCPAIPALAALVSVSTSCAGREEPDPGEMMAVPGGYFQVGDPYAGGDGDE
ncbi:MAG TPA: hypothetical protein PLM14_02980 [Candidatus Hydrogenedentes bacterium]|nr:hypothetical protein [Candidatus Hydrogenedentota bacterium]HQH52238.1 hypothetical protein [Candidatus Hydrogenedentota bacterium]